MKISTNITFEHGRANPLPMTKEQKKSRRKIPGEIVIRNAWLDAGHLVEPSSVEIDARVNTRLLSSSTSVAP